MPSVEIVQSHLFGPETARAISTCLEGLGLTGRVFITANGGYVIVESDGRTTWQEGYGRGSVASHLHQAGLFCVVNRNGQALPPKDLLTSLAYFNLALKAPAARGSIPAVTSLVNSPAYRLSHDRLVRRPAGFDAEDRVFTLSAGGVSASQVDPAYPHLHKLFSGLQFVDPVYHANLLGYTVAMFARTALQEFPLLLLDSRYKSCGKSKVGSALGRLLSSWESPPFQVTFTGAEDEVEKKFKPISGTPGPSFILFDNVRAKRGRGGDMPHDIRSQFLAQIATSKTCYPRVMNEGCGVQLFDPVAVLTMNRAHVEHDLHDRTVRLILTRPTRTAHFKLVPHPEEYVVENRPALLSEVHAILSSLVLAPIAGATFNSRFYRFEQIAVGAARALGLDACYGGDRVDTCDSLLRELYTAVTEDFTDRAPDVVSLASTLNAGPSYTEFRSWFAALRVPVKAYPKHVRELLDEVAGQPFRIDGRLATFVLDFDERINQPTVKVVYNE